MNHSRGSAASAPRLSLVALCLLAAVCLCGCTWYNERRAMNRGVNFYKSKEYEKAAGAFKQAISINPGYAEAHLDLGLTYMSLYEPGSEHPKDVEYASGAIEAFKKYIQLTPDSDKGKEYLINVCKSARRMQDAIDFFLPDVEKNPQDLKKARMIAVLYQMGGNSEKAIEWYAKVAEIDLSNPEAHYSVSVACWARSYNSIDLDYETRMKLIDTGIASMERALQLRTDYYEAYSYLSLLYRERMKYDISPAQSVMWRQKADEHLAKAMELRNKQLAAMAAAAAKAQGDTAASPAKSEGR
jgi:hypothetical protein